MEEGPRRLRADAERNRLRLVAAATEMLRERGLDVSVGEIAERAGVGRGTLFRNFPSKEALLGAVVAQQIREQAEQARSLLDRDHPGEALLRSFDDFLARQRDNRALVEALADTWMMLPEVETAHEEMFGVMEQLLHRAQQAGEIRGDISAVDVMLMFKGVCEAMSAFPGLDPEIGHRQLDLVRAALTTTGESPRALRGAPPSLDTLTGAHRCAAPAMTAVTPPARVVGD